MSENEQTYYVPEQSKWPIIAAIGLFCLGIGSINLLHAHLVGPIVFVAGIVILIITLFGWFGAVVREGRKGLYSEQMERSFRWGMLWFIFSEVMFFGAFFGALFYVRLFAVPWIGGEGSFELTGLLLWPDFTVAWPLFTNPNPVAYPGPKEVLSTWGIPAFNTLLLLTSAVTLTWAHWNLKRGLNKRLIVGMILTILLGISFVCMQIHEYYIAHNHYGLTIYSGIYGSTFYVLTGFHALHVTVGLIILIVMLIRALRSHFTSDNHFGFEAAAWYWHFVDVVWLFLFIFVYWL